MYICLYVIYMLCIVYVYVYMLRYYLPGAILKSFAGDTTITIAEANLLYVLTLVKLYDF